MAFKSSGFLFIPKILDVIGLLFLFRAAYCDVNLSVIGTDDVFSFSSSIS